jgi:hypothetical protein
MATESGARVDAAALPASFRVGTHEVRVARVNEGRWLLQVDGVALEGSYRSEAEAWEAGVREADRRDRAAT